MRSRAERLERLAAEATALRKQPGRKRKAAWPPAFQRCALELMHAGYRASEISARTQIPAMTLHCWRQWAEKKNAKRETKKKLRIRKASPPEWHELVVKEDSSSCLRLRVGANCELAGLTLAQVEDWLKRKVI